MTLNDQAILALSLFAMVMVVCDFWRAKPRSLYLGLAIIALALLPIVKRFLFV